MLCRGTSEGLTIAATADIAALPKEVRMSKTLLFATAFCSLALSAPAWPKSAGSSGEAAVRRVYSEGLKAFNAHQLDAFVALYAKDGAFYAPGAPAAEGQAAIKSLLRPFMKDPALHYSLDFERIEVSRSGDVAYALYTYDQTTTDPHSHKVVHERGHGIDTLRKTAGFWKFVDTISAPEPAS
jgi:uncharacterized protein (TIGR02246 family)